MYILMWNLLGFDCKGKKEIIIRHLYYTNIFIILATRGGRKKYVLSQSMTSQNMSQRGERATTTECVMMCVSKVNFSRD